jgi:hypothetical protein
VLVTPPSSPEGSQQQPAFKGFKESEIALRNPLEAETRKARLYLLGVSLVSITIVQTGLVPQELTTLGITFGEADRQSLLSILALVIVYFTFAFAIYGFSDFLAWRFAYSNLRVSELIAEIERSTEASHRAIEEAKSNSTKVEMLTRKVRLGRASLPEDLQWKVDAVLDAAQKRVLLENSVPLEKRAILDLEKESAEREAKQKRAEGEAERKREAYLAAQEEERHLAERLSQEVASLSEELRTNVENVLEASSELREANSEAVMIRIRQAAGAASQTTDGAFGVPVLPVASAVSWVRALFEFLLPSSSASMLSTLSCLPSIVIFTQLPGRGILRTSLLESSPRSA